ncbi:hypothetical protein [Massilia rubra]|uniref:TonB C-terminal domain-containing protein n=1 Tax=Massilia rubra TaxID=2607910 RepID=A0ABX0LN21_9BURK|nr:hypothetical protein [Massilia rubra]NHZ33632.1 hypothetical protein [Massilia rubra]
MRAPADHPVAVGYLERAHAAFQKMKQGLPAADAAIVENVFSDGKPLPERTEQVICDSVWTTSHAIVDATVEDARWLRMAVTHFEYTRAFQGVAASRVSRPTPPGFTPGKAFVHRPLLLARRKVSGAMGVTILVDSTGKVSDVKIAWNSLRPGYVTSANGDSFTAVDLVLPVLSAYFSDGRFEPRLVDGVPAPFSVSQEIEWK